MPKVSKVNKVVARYLYGEEGRTLKEIADVYDVTPVNIWNF